jgi:hypothetical protein
MPNSPGRCAESAAGTNVFESGPAGTNPNIVRVPGPNRQKLFYLGFTVPIVRPRDAEPSS